MHLYENTVSFIIVFHTKVFWLVIWRHMLRWNCINAANVLIFSHRNTFSQLLQSIREYTLGRNHYHVISVTKVFSENSTLIKHQQVHTGEKPFLCDQCNISFSEIANHTKHQKVHTWKKPFLCDQCDKIFFERFTL